ncbi:septum formation initiator family protein [Haloechinothrix sp. LS1_15]|uniref:FtsB family cell division protein n=1 Tax=Haloechinothrix sp. LS1_15 TaxID=2652248 RepID=UPI00294AD117|nr:septum formation initiator family protein [Haloechinothrix sp. LS1_15]
MRTIGLTTTRRAAVVALVLCALVFTLAVPLRTYLAQQAEIAEQEERQEQLEAEIERLEERRAELDDPVQVEAEARARLRYVMPGETPFIVQLPEDTAEAAGADEDDGEDAAGPWYEQLWSSITG